MEAPAPGVGISAAVERRSPALPPIAVSDCEITDASFQPCTVPNNDINTSISTNTNIDINTNINIDTNINTNINPDINTNINPESAAEAGTLPSGARFRGCFRGCFRLGALFPLERGRPF